MSRFSFACSSHGPAIVQHLWQDRTLPAALERNGVVYEQAAAALREGAGDKGFSQRLETGQITPEDMSRYIVPLFTAFAHMTDPSAGRGSSWKYLDWVCRTWLAAPCQAEDIDKIKGDLQDFESFQRFMPQEQRAIQAYDSRRALQDTLRPFQNRRDAKIMARQQASDEIKAETTVVYDGPEGKIVIPRTERASIFWGRGSTWCISATKSKNYFDDYNKTAPIYIYMPKASAIEQERFPNLCHFKYAGTNGTCFDELDHNISYKIPCLEKLINAAQQALADTAKADHNQKEKLFSLTEIINAVESCKENKTGLDEIKSHFTALAQVPPGTEDHFIKYGSTDHLKSIANPGGMIWNDEAALCEAMQSHPAALIFAADCFRDDSDFVKNRLAKAESHAEILQAYRHLTPALRNDSQVTLALIEQCSSNQGLVDTIKASGESGRNDPQIALAAIQKCDNNVGLCFIIKACGEAVRNNPQVALAAIEKCDGYGPQLENIIKASGESVRNNAQVALTAIEKCTDDMWLDNIIAACGESVRANRTVIMAALRKTEYDFRRKRIKDLAAPSIRDEWCLATKARWRLDTLFPKLFGGKPAQKEAAGGCDFKGPL